MNTKRKPPQSSGLSKNLGHGKMTGRFSTAYGSTTRKPSQDITLVLSLLDKVRETPNGWMACCPFHPDRSASLSIRDTGTLVLLHCFGGCSYSDICDALGIGTLELERDIMATKRGRKIAKLSRRSHQVEAALLRQDYGLSSKTADRLVRERLQRSRLHEVQEFLKGKRGQAVDATDYFTIECGLSRSVAEDLAGRYRGGQIDA